MKTKYSLFSTIFLAALLVAVEAQAGTLDDIGFTDLTLELGSALPDGSSIAVTQAEAPVSVACIPDMTLEEFNLITFNDHTSGLTVCTDGEASGHATSVATKFYGAFTSSVTAISIVDLYEAGNWLGAGFLNTGGAGIGVSTTRLINHSWTAPAADWAGEILRRVDYLVEVDEFIQVVGVSTNTVTNETPSNSFNAIVAGLSAGTGTTGTKAIDTTYVSGRAKPDIAAPEGVGSTSAPRVSSAAVLLMDYAHTHPLLSNGSVTNSNGDIINNAERSETVKALLMAGADRATVGNTNAVDITDYRVAGKQTSNGLDTRFGAGQVNVNNSYHILAAGEQSSAEDGGTTMANTGFDYDSAFGGSNSSNAIATYSFTTSTSGGQKLKAALVWNLEVFDASSANLYDLDLQLIDVTAGSTIVASSTSPIDNTENLWFDLASNNDYRLKVIRGSGQAAFNWDYALAWQISTLPVVTAGQLFAIDENSALATEVSTVTATVPTGTITKYAIFSGDMNNVFAISDSGVLTVAGTIDYETTASYSLGIAATDGLNVSNTETVVVNVNNINDVAPVIAASQTLNIDENSPVDASVSAVVADDVDSAITGFSIVGGSTVFAIDISGLITVTGTLDYETTPSYTLSIIATDSINTSVAVDVVININNLDEVAPTVSVAQSFSIDENSANGALVGTVIATDAADASGMVSGFNIVSGNTGNVFAIANNGGITVVDTVDYETATSYTLGVTATDDSGNTSSAVNVVINVNDLNDIAPAISSLQAFNINENSANGAAVGTVIANDVDSAITGFAIVGGSTVFAFDNNGLITVAGVLDYETTPSYTLSITATDGMNTSVPVDVLISVNDLNDVAPIVAASQTLNVDENSPVGANVGVVVADDVDSAITGFAIVGGSTVFAIDGSGLITVAGALDYETTPSYTLSITATDGTNTSVAVDVVININNLDEIAPVVVSSQSFSVDENAANATVMGTVVATDAQGVVSGFNIVSGNTGNVFAIASNGVITVVGIVDYETTASYTLGITASDGVNTSAPVNVVVTVNDIVESSASASSSGGGGSLSMLWLLVPLFITAGRRRML